MIPEINYWIWSCILLSKQYHPGLKVIQVSTSIIWSLNIVFSYVTCNKSVDIGRTRSRTFTESSPPLVRIRIFSWNINSANKFSLETFYHYQEWNLKHLHLRKPQFSTTVTNYWPREEIRPSLSEPNPSSKDLCIVFEEIPKKI